jgi:WD40 repeat protein
VWSVAFSPDGEMLASGGCEEVSPDSSSCAAGVIRLWDVGTGEEIATLGGHIAEVLSVAFSPDGETLASTSPDGSIILWDMPSGQMLGPLLTSSPDVGRPVLSAAFSPDGRSLATGNDRGAVMLWDVGYESWQARACRRANRNMTREEWNQYMGSDVPYQCTCPDLPCPVNEADSDGEP